MSAPADGVRGEHRRHRHRRRNKVRIAGRTFTWWHVLLAIAVGLLGVVLTIHMLSRGAPIEPEP